MMTALLWSSQLPRSVMSAFSALFSTTPNHLDGVRNLNLTQIPISLN